MQLTNKYNKGIFIMLLIFLVNMDGLMIWWVDKLLMLFKKFLDKPNHHTAKSEGPKPNEIWVDKGK